jgi:hypothetical protein
MTRARFGVDPAELLAAASATGDVAAAARAARSALESLGDPHHWAEDQQLASVAAAAGHALRAAATVAAARAAALEQELRVSAEGYARSDAQWVR